MPGIYKIGMTADTRDRLKDANASNVETPTPYNIEMSVKVTQAYVKEQALHKLLEHYGKRIHPRRVLVFLYEVKMFFYYLTET